MKKKFLVGLLAIVMCFALVGCGKTENGGSTNNGGSNNGGSSTGSTKIEDISTSNYVSVTKSNFGIDQEVSGLKIKTAKAQGSSQINLVFTVESGDEESLVKEFFNRCLDASDDKAIYRQDWPNDGGYTVSVGERKTSWEVWKQGSSYDQNWFYQKDGKYIAFGGSIQNGGVFDVTINFK